jgi:hypothetical protein
VAGTGLGSNASMVGYQPVFHKDLGEGSIPSGATEDTAPVVIKLRYEQRLFHRSDARG